MRPVLFNTVPRRPLGLFSNQSLPAMKCEIIEKYLEPNLDEVVDLFFQYANICFPIFDEGSFRNVYGMHREKISPALLCNLYANSLIYWENSSELSSSRLPDVRYIWNQANEALHSELFLSPGISTVMAIILNVCGRPSTSIFGNGGMVGTAVALSNALGLNRDPSNWNISPLEKRFRIRIWWLVVVNDRWCSLAYGTPLQIHRAQYDVPFPTVDDLQSNCTSQSHIAAAEVFVAFTSLTEVMSEYLEHVYKISVHVPYPPERSAIELEGLLTDWEESLTGNIRRMVLHGTDFDAPGAANFRLAYLAVKLLLRRLQLDVDKNNLGIIDDIDSHYYKQAQRAAEEIVHLVQEMGESHLRGFWLPVNSFSLTSATTFLLRSGLRKGGLNNYMFLDIAKDMIDRLRSHSESFRWDLADNCLASCSDLVDKISSNSTQDVFFDSTVSNFFQEHLDFNQSFLNDFMADFPEITPTVRL
ncbi:uncharacterized protein TRUGW13939_06540 [Talaromyces rugulosus]|uniref:Xylanolytic transcriptional activator regulatory domain-containing protein n=1 Tax=Talaromyces rugulosus TaxID=121627 RepID=A0A7H8R068_TALRU|nr:uncharacterized protein TRUGW13939_06540 [Talaromyces rugulosus]QKX59406.1 hypothetical protein TRUGW13939_06540 [Talaromyces rugulosus]